MVVIALCILICYQYQLKAPGMTEYMYNQPRDNFISANREGIFSLCGYVPLYIVVEVFSSRYIFGQQRYSIPRFGAATGEVDRQESTAGPTVPLLTLATAAGALYYLSDRYLQPSSRRLVNLSFVSFVVFVCSFLLSQFALVRETAQPFPFYCTLNFSCIHSWTMLLNLEI